MKHLDIRLTFPLLLLALALAGCGDDGGAGDASSDTGIGVDSATDTGTDSSADASDASSDANSDAALLGCADGSVTCPDDQMCCSGVPYPMEGICQVDCPAVSDRNAKHEVESVDGDAILRRLATLPISEWSYRQQGEVRHVGPMAQDFHREFGLGADDRHIHPVDAAGITMAALQSLLTRVEDLEQDNTALREETVRLQREVDALTN